MNEPIKFDRFATSRYYGPVMDTADYEGHNYLVNVPVPLSEQQMKVLVEMLALMAPNTSWDDHDKVELRIARPNWENLK